MTYRQSIIMVTALLLLWGCNGRKTGEESKETCAEWYRGSEVVKDDGTVDMDALDKDKIDLIYLVSTDVMSNRNADGSPKYQSSLTEEDRNFIDMELAFAQSKFSKGDFNYLAPYYHQFTFEAVVLPENEFKAEFARVTEEVNGIMDYYLEEINGGRKFALAGFSQGAMLVVEILKHCTKEQLKNMVGAYVIGYGLSEEDLRCENIIPATDEEGYGQTVSFNSVISRDVKWPLVYNNAATVINPVNWKTDSTEGEFEYEGQTIRVAIDEEVNELIVSVPDKTPYHEFMTTNPAFTMAKVDKDCLHHWDLLFYTEMIHDNIIKRAESCNR